MHMYFLLRFYENQRSGFPYIILSSVITTSISICQHLYFVRKKTAYEPFPFLQSGKDCVQDEASQFGTMKLSVNMGKIGGNRLQHGRFVQ